jgi:hypothetical protein
MTSKNRRPRMPMGGEGHYIFSTFVDVVGVDALFVARQIGPVWR